MNYDTYSSPFSSRYASKEMLYIFSQDKRFTTWRKLWIALAQSEQELGLAITDEQIRQMQDNINIIDYEYADKMERELRHDVMAHIYAYGKVAPDAMPIIHLGATSCYVGDNADLIIMREAVSLVIIKLVNVLNNLKSFALQYKDTPTLGYTHFQPAQLVTVGKRAALWMQDLVMDIEYLEFTVMSLMFLGAKGTTGTQASFMNLFDNDHEKVKLLDKLVAEKLDFNRVQPVSGQTYSRKQDSKVLAALASVAESAHKMCTDLRLLASLKEIEEPFEDKQVGSSAMAYKRNPMRSERVCSLARFVISLSANPYYTHATQWFERTLDDSSNRRLSIPESFLGIDSILELLMNITSGLVVYEKTIEKNIIKELPFMVTENILMEAVKQGGDRQQMHEIIREHSIKASFNVKQYGKENNLLDLLADDERVPLSNNQINALMNPQLYIGRASEQVSEYIQGYVDPILFKYKEALGIKSNIKV